MSTTSSLNPSEVVARGKALYEARLRAKMDTETNLGKLLMIDIDSGDYETGDDGDDLQILDRLRAYRPNATIFSMKIGYPAAAIGTRLMSYREQQNSEESQDNTVH